MNGGFSFAPFLAGLLRVSGISLKLDFAFRLYFANIREMHHKYETIIIRVILKIGADTAAPSITSS